MRVCGGGVEVVVVVSAANTCHVESLTWATHLLNDDDGVLSLTDQ